MTLLAGRGTTYTYAHVQRKRRTAATGELTFCGWYTLFGTRDRTVDLAVASVENSSQPSLIETE